jgi:hypothetical protein
MPCRSTKRSPALFERMSQSCFQLLQFVNLGADDRQLLSDQVPHV